MMRNFLTYHPLDFILVLYPDIGVSVQEGNMNIFGFEIKSKEEREQEELSRIHI